MFIYKHNFISIVDCCIQKLQLSIFYEIFISIIDYYRNWKFWLSIFFSKLYFWGMTKMRKFFYIFLYHL